jgi:ribosomal protein S18 acetylase RimI-like enzyme
LNHSAAVGEIRENDLPAIRPLIAELVEAMEDSAGFDLDRAMENCRVLLGRPDHALLLAQIEGTACGFVHLTTRQSILHDRPSGLIEELVVSREFRGQGIGRLLMDAAIGRCLDIGCCEVEVSTEASNWRAREFYVKRGFDYEGMLFELHFPIADAPQDARLRV